MTVKAPTPQEYLNRKIIHGSTTINHRIRVQLQLSCEEYTLLDFVRNHNVSSEKKITFGDYYRNTGYIPEDIRQFIEGMKQKGLLVWNDKEQRVDVYDEWKNVFSGDFDQLWKILKKGNKTDARSKFAQCIKKISFEELKDKLEAYVKHCDTNNIFKKGLNIWLNPKKEHWNDPLVANQVRNNNSQPKNNTQIRFKT